MQNVHKASSFWKAATSCGLAALLFAMGCDSKSKPTPENFTATLNKYFLEHADCLLPNPPRFPFETTDPEQTKQMDSLVKAQLLTVKREEKIHVSRYTATDIGARSVPRFCYGHRVVKSIDSSTAPAKGSDGFTESQVTYHYEMKDVPVWARMDEVKAAFPDMAHKLSGEASDTKTLAVNSAGWQVPD